VTARPQTAHASPRGVRSAEALCSADGAGPALPACRIDQSETAQKAAAVGRQVQRLFVSPDDGVLARLHRMCDIRLAAVNPAAPKSSRAQTFSFYFSLSFALL
jgi:hypothetical protein